MSLVGVELETLVSEPGRYHYFFFFLYFIYIQTFKQHKQHKTVFNTKRILHAFTSCQQLRLSNPVPCGSELNALLLILLSFFLLKTCGKKVQS